MAARRCLIDGINYPADYRAAKCVVCNEPTEYFTNVVPDDDWMDKVAVLLEQQAKADEEPPDILTANARVEVCGEFLCVSSDDVYHSASSRREWPLPPLTLIQIGQQVFEVLAYRREPTKHYIVRSFSLTLSDEDLERLACPE